MIEDDGDIVRGLGFVVLHAAHLEGQIEDMLFQLSAIEPYTEKEKKLPISKKIKKAINVLAKFKDSFALKIIEELNSCSEHFEWRNEVVHGRIYSPEYHDKNLVSGRENVPARKADSSELYMLANNFVALKGRISWPLTLPNFIANAQKENA